MKPAGFWDWLGPSVLMAMFITYLLLSSPSEVLFCSEDESCFREWVAALSGWAAAIAAFATIRSLRQQAESAQKQTDFQLGDALPTIDAVQHTEISRRAVIRIRNWNRRSMIIRRVSVIKPSDIDASLFLFFNAKQYPDMARKFGDLAHTGRTSITFDPAILVEGWVKREEEPTLMKFAMSVFVRESQTETGWGKFPIELEYELVGETKRNKVTTHVHVVSGATDLDTDILYE